MLVNEKEKKRKRKKRKKNSLNYKLNNRKRKNIYVVT